VKNILITSIGRRVQLTRAFVQAIENLGCGGKIITVDAGNYVPAAHFSHFHIKVPGFDSKEYIPSLLDICRKQRVGLLIPLHEKEFAVLDQAKEEFSKNETVVMLSSKEVLDICKDKYLTYLFFKEHNINTIPTYYPEAIKSLGDLSFPLFIKPRTGMGSTNSFRINNNGEMAFFLEHVSDPIVQEYIEGIEYTMDVLNDLNGQCITVVPRERIEVRSGEVSKSRTTKDWDLINKTKTIAEALGGVGPLTIQAFKKENGEIVFIEINPRFGGGVPLAIKAGVNYPALLAEIMSGQRVRPRLGEFRNNLYMLRYDEAIYLEKEDVEK